MKWTRKLTRDNLIQNLMFQNHKNNFIFFFFFFLVIAENRDAHANVETWPNNC